MTQQQKRDLAELLKDLYHLDFFSSCSDQYFRQVFTQKIQAIQAFGYDKMLIAEADAQEECKSAPQKKSGRKE